MVLNPTESFERELAALKGVEVIRDLKKAKQVQFSLAFVTKQEEIDALAPAIARKVEGDAIVWFAYPKGTSKKYKPKSIGTTAGTSLATRVLSRSGWWPLTRIGLRLGSAALDLSRA